jgi:hypothetical protein
MINTHPRATYLRFTILTHPILTHPITQPFPAARLASLAATHRSMLYRAAKSLPKPARNRLFETWMTWKEIKSGRGTTHILGEKERRSKQALAPTFHRALLASFAY